MPRTSGPLIRQVLVLEFPPLGYLTQAQTIERCYFPENKAACLRIQNDMLVLPKTEFHISASSWGKCRLMMTLYS